MSKQIEIEDFLKIQMHVGTILSAKPNARASKPAYILEVDFGGDLGIKITSAQITDFYNCDDLPGIQVVAVTNFPPLRVAGVKSEVLVLGTVTEEGVILLRPDRPVQNGMNIA